jgi:thioredoxin reductase (NADPH)
VTVVQRGPEPHAQATYVERARALPNLEVLQGDVAEILGEQAVAGVRLASSQQLEAAGVFVYVGLQPNTSPLASHGVLTDTGHVVTDSWMRTASPGLLAAGDIRADSAGQAISAAGDGATAAVAAHRYLNGGAWV